MDIFTQKKILVRLVIALALLNLIVIGVFVMRDILRPGGPPFGPPPPPQELSEILKKELKLTDKQARDLKTLRTTFFEKEKVLSTTIREERDSMNAAMFNKTTSDAEVRSLAKRISENEYKMELLRYEQARELKTICTPEQLDKFQGMLREIRDYFRPDNRPPRPRP